MTSNQPDAPMIKGIATPTSIARSEPDKVFIRDVNLVEDLMGKVGFTEMMLFQLNAKMPTPDEVAVAEAIMVALMEHGLTPSSISARLIYSSSPDAMQAAIAAGLLGAGSSFLGSMEGLGASLQAGVRAIRSGETDSETWSRALISAAKAEGRPVPGFGHHIHRPDDPRTGKVFEIAATRGFDGEHTALVTVLQRELDAAKGKHITMNVTGAIAAVLSDMDYPWQVFRGFSLVARAAGLFGHILEEQRRPLGREIWDLVERATPYAPNNDPATTA